MSSVLDSLIAAGSSFQMVGAEKLKERLLKLVVQEGIDSGWQSGDSAMVVNMWKVSEVWWLVS